MGDHDIHAQHPDELASVMHDLAQRRVSGMSGPRILAIMGSGETAPTMAKVHRALFERFGGEPAPAAILDTPYGFQENADELSARTVALLPGERRAGGRRRHRTGRATSTR